ncbi:MAG: hypothetical protein HPY85_14180 [Anaerolineae bacterium]|nr:hypothetical protein [Anaerolineae bacterium]
MNGTIPDSQANTRPGEEDLFRSEIREHLDIRQQRRWIFPRAALVGAVAGIAALAFRAALTGADLVRNSLLEWSHQYPRWGWVIPVVVVAALATAAVALTRHFAPEASGSGIPHLEAHMRISALVAPDAADSLALLKYGCGSLKEALQPQDQTRRQM